MLISSFINRYTERQLYLHFPHSTSVISCVWQHYYCIQVHQHASARFNSCGHEHMINSIHVSVPVGMNAWSTSYTMSHVHIVYWGVQSYDMGAIGLYQTTKQIHTQAWTVIVIRETVIGFERFVAGIRYVVYQNDLVHHHVITVTS